MFFEVRSIISDVFSFLSNVPRRIFTRPFIKCSDYAADTGLADVYEPCIVEDAFLAGFARVFDSTTRQQRWICGRSCGCAEQNGECAGLEQHCCGVLLLTVVLLGAGWSVEWYRVRRTAVVVQGRCQFIYIAVLIVVLDFLRIDFTRRNWYGDDRSV